MVCLFFFSFPNLQYGLITNFFSFFQFLDENVPTDSPTLSEMQTSEFASLDAFSSVSNINNQFNFDQPENFAESSPIVNNTEDELVSSQGVSQGSAVSKFSVTGNRTSSISEPVVDSERKLHFSDDNLLTEKVFSLERPEENKFIEDQATFNDNAASFVNKTAHYIDDSLGLSSSDTFESSTPLVTEENSNDTLDFTEGRTSFSQSEHSSKNNFSNDLTHPVAELQDQLKISESEPSSDSKLFNNSHIPQIPIASISSKNSHESLFEVTDEPQPSILSKSDVNFDFDETVLESQNDINSNVLANRDIGLNSDLPASEAIFASTVKDTKSSSEHDSVGMLTHTLNSEIPVSNHDGSSGFEIEKSIVTTSFDNAFPSSTTGISHNTTDISANIADSFGVAKLIDSKLETSPMTDGHVFDANIISKDLPVKEVLKDSADSISSDDFFESSSKPLVDHAQHFVEDSDNDQSSFKSINGEPTSELFDAVVDKAGNAPSSDASFVSITDNHASLLESSERVLDISTETKTEADIPDQENGFRSPIDPISSKNFLVSPSEVDAKRFENSTEPEFNTAGFKEIANSTPNFSSLINTLNSPSYRARSPGADLWTPAPPSTDSSPELEPWSPKEVHFSLPNSPAAEAVLTMPVRLSDAEHLQLSDAEDLGSDQPGLTETQLNVSEPIESNLESLSFAHNELDNKFEIESIPLEKSAIKLEKSKFESLSDDDNEILPNHTSNVFISKPEALSKFFLFIYFIIIIIINNLLLFFQVPMYQLSLTRVNLHRRLLKT